MIGLLNGKIELLKRPFIILDVAGVGYKVLVPDKTYSKLTMGQKLKIFTYTYVREDELALFGFLEPEDLTLFESLISVSGIGPKTALNIFSFGERKEIMEAIVKGEVSFFTSVPRLGTKNAQRIIIELKSKMGSDSQIDLSGADSVDNDQVIDALKNFGFTVGEAQKALRSIKKPGATTEDKIRLALKQLGR